MWEKRADAGQERQERPTLGGKENSRRKRPKRINESQVRDMGGGAGGWKTD